MDKQNKKSSISIYTPPVVAVLGHVDHGKTTLLDAIRKTSIAQRERGGITQKIGASSIEFLNEGVKRQVTFIDTPGHELFSSMRGRGIQAADLVLLVVSCVDGVMPQTRESIKLLKEAETPFIVVLTKADLPEKNPEKVKQQLLKEEVLLEGYGGDVPVVEVSAKTNTNIKELLELILLVHELHPNSSVSENQDLKAVVIEARQDPKMGPLVTIVIKNGRLSVRDELAADGIYCRVKAIINDKGERLNSVTIGEGVEILGFEKVPGVGGIVIKKDAKTAHPSVSAALPLEAKRSEAGFQKEESILSVILRADSLGSLEAIVNALPKEINVISQKTGGVTPADVIFAKSTKAIILGFNIKIKPEVEKLIHAEKILVKNYTLIYELIDEIKDVLEGKQLSMQEEILGRAKIIASFPFEKTKVAGIKIIEGRIAKGDRIRLTRDDDIVGESTISSLRQGKNSVSKAEQGNEAGAIIFPFLDFTIGDMVISFA